jgi:hypothetical protein
MGWILLIILILLLMGAFPRFGVVEVYWPSGILGTLLIIVLVLLIIGKL